MVRFWRRERIESPAVGAATPHQPSLSADAATDRDAAATALPVPGAAPSGAPEQPVLLAPNGTRRPVHVGEVLPARARRWPLALIRVPTVPKRAILAAGVCAGLAAPGIARHLAARLLLGNPAAAGGAALEVTRIVYTGPLTPRAAAAIGKAIEASRR